MKTIDVSDEISTVECVVGQNAQENWNLLDNSQPQWHFFHLSAFPSCYVILKADDPSNETINDAAKICLQNTKHRNAKNVLVDHTVCSNVQKGTVQGELQYKSRRKVKVIRSRI